MVSLKNINGQLVTGRLIRAGDSGLQDPFYHVTNEIDVQLTSYEPGIEMLVYPRQRSTRELLDTLRTAWEHSPFISFRGVLPGLTDHLLLTIGPATPWSVSLSFGHGRRGEQLLILFPEVEPMCRLLPAPSTAPTDCTYFSGKLALKCAVNPSGDCSSCSDYCPPEPTET